MEIDDLYNLIHAILVKSAPLSSAQITLQKRVLQLLKSVRRNKDVTGQVLLLLFSINTEKYIEVMWALESTTTNKPTAGDGITVELFQILKDRKSTRLNSSHTDSSRMPSSA